jgi:hypothetical protein
VRAVIFCAFFAGQSVLSAELVTLQIASPENKAVVHPRQSLKVVVKASGTGLKDVYLVGTGDIGFSKQLTSPPYEFIIGIPSRHKPGLQVLTADGYAGSDVKVKPHRIFLDIERADSPLSLRVEPSFFAFPASDGSYLSPVDENAPIDIYGSFEDGTALNLSQSTLTKFSSDNPAVADIESHGYVRTRIPGLATLKITN